MTQSLCARPLISLLSNEYKPKPSSMNPVAHSSLSLCEIKRKNIFVITNILLSHIIDIPLLKNARPEEINGLE